MVRRQHRVDERPRQVDVPAAELELARSCQLLQLGPGENDVGEIVPTMRAMNTRCVRGAYLLDMTSHNDTPCRE